MVMLLLMDIIQVVVVDHRLAHYQMETMEEMEHPILLA